MVCRHFTVAVMQNLTISTLKVSSYVQHKKFFHLSLPLTVSEVDFITIVSHVDREFRNRKIKLSITYLIGYTGKLHVVFKTYVLLHKNYIKDTERQYQKREKIQTLNVRQVP